MDDMDEFDSDTFDDDLYEEEDDTEETDIAPFFGGLLKTQSEIEADNIKEKKEKLQKKTDEKKKLQKKADERKKPQKKNTDEEKIFEDEESAGDAKRYHTRPRAPKVVDDEPASDDDIFEDVVDDVPTKKTKGKPRKCLLCALIQPKLPYYTLKGKPSAVSRKRKDPSFHVKIPTFSPWIFCFLVRLKLAFQHLIARLFMKTKRLVSEMWRCLPLFLTFSGSKSRGDEIEGKLHKLLGTIPVFCLPGNPYICQLCYKKTLDCYTMWETSVAGVKEYLEVCFASLKCQTNRHKGWSPSMVFSLFLQEEEQRTLLSLYRKTCHRIMCPRRR